MSIPDCTDGIVRAVFINKIINAICIYNYNLLKYDCFDTLMQQKGEDIEIGRVQM